MAKLTTDSPGLTVPQLGIEDFRIPEENWGAVYTAEEDSDAERFGPAYMDFGPKRPTSDQKKLARNSIPEGWTLLGYRNHNTWE